MQKRFLTLQELWQDERQALVQENISLKAAKKT